MLVIWDNRSCLHRAYGGYDGYDRELHRTTVYCVSEHTQGSGTTTAWRLPLGAAAESRKIVIFSRFLDTLLQTSG